MTDVASEPRHLIKLTPGTPVGDHYDYLASVFRPVFARIAEGARQRDAERQLPIEQVGWLNAARFGALRIPQEHGGFGASLLDTFRLLIELAEADSQVAHLLRAHIAFVEQIQMHPDPAVREKWINRVVAGQIVGNAYTERGGNALGTWNTAISATPYGVFVSGTKYYCTGTIFADWTVVAATHPQRPGRHLAVVSTQHSGVRMYDDWDGFGQQLTGTGSTEFDTVPVDTLIVPVDQFEHVESTVFQLVLLAVQAGITRAVLADARLAVQARTRNFTTGTGVPLRDEPQVLQLIGEISGQVLAVESIVLAAVAEVEALLADEGLSEDERHLVCELTANRAHTAVQPLVLAAASKMFDGLGASSTSTSCNFDRHWRNARTIATHNPAIYRARIVGDYEVNGRAPVTHDSAGDVPESYA
ncbi:acyl-CoA dehydrogenase family protein [Zhihengliuella sp.]|uniref:acyl-CoA dehydrogenase family protein n=1 Tax=Zhihengliuella sp. TaxID=1954483 RepID=UPI0028120B73|nr:acyl-CoA dehydrogenase family protein [Zhihengliuella sp.]